MRVKKAMVVIRPQIRVCTYELFSYFLSKTYVVGTQKNRLNETVLLKHPKHIFKLTDKKIIVFYAEKFCLTGPMVMSIYWLTRTTRWSQVKCNNIEIINK